MKTFKQFFSEADIESHNWGGTRTTHTIDIGHPQYDLRVDYEPHDADHLPAGGGHRKVNFTLRNKETGDESYSRSAAMNNLSPRHRTAAVRGVLSSVAKYKKENKPHSLTAVGNTSRKSELYAKVLNRMGGKRHLVPRKEVRHGYVGPRGPETYTYKNESPTETGHTILFPHNKRHQNA